MYSPVLPTNRSGLWFPILRRNSPLHPCQSSFYRSANQPIDEEGVYLAPEVLIAASRTSERFPPVQNASRVAHAHALTHIPVWESCITSWFSQKPYVSRCFISYFISDAGHLNRTYPSHSFPHRTLNKLEMALIRGAGRVFSTVKNC